MRQAVSVQTESKLGRFFKRNGELQCNRGKYRIHAALFIKLRCFVSLLDMLFVLLELRVCVSLFHFILKNKCICKIFIVITWWCINLALMCFPIWLQWHLFYRNVKMFLIWLKTIIWYYNFVHYNQNKTLESPNVSLTYSRALQVKTVIYECIYQNVYHSSLVLYLSHFYLLVVTKNTHLRTLFVFATYYMIITT